MSTIIVTVIRNDKTHREYRDSNDIWNQKEKKQMKSYWEDAEREYKKERMQDIYAFLLLLVLILSMCVSFVKHIRKESDLISPAPASTERYETTLLR